MSVLLGTGEKEEILDHLHVTNNTDIVLRLRESLRNFSMSPSPAWVFDVFPELSVLLVNMICSCGVMILHIAWTTFLGWLHF